MLMTALLVLLMAAERDIGGESGERAERQGSRGFRVSSSGGSESGTVVSPSAASLSRFEAGAVGAEAALACDAMVDNA
jgi:hypothetical protein